MLKGKKKKNEITTGERHNTLSISHNLRCDESAATGESNPVKKNEYTKGDCIIISGSKVLQGVAKVLVIAVGENSFYGRAMMVSTMVYTKCIRLNLILVNA